jgi:hypothetical protein
MQVQDIPEPDKDGARNSPFVSTWWRARAIRDRLEKAVVRGDLLR